MTRRHSLSLTVNNSSAMQTEPNCEKAESFLAPKNNYEELKISLLGKQNLQIMMKNSYIYAVQQKSNAG